MTATPSLPDTMRRIRFDGAGGPEVLKLANRPVPVSGPARS